MSPEQDKPNGDPSVAAVDVTAARPTEALAEAVEPVSSVAVATPAPLEDPAPAAVPAGAPAADLLEHFTRLEELITDLSKQIGFLPPQIRQLSSKVDGVAVSITEPRQRALLLGVVALYDLADQMARSAQRAEPDSAHAKNYDVLRVQLRQLLETNGLQEIDASGRFNPLLHRALERVPVTERERDEQIIEVTRAGFRTEFAVLRFAEVSVGRFGAANPAASGNSSGNASSPN
jgi:hypothetical protein